MAVGLREVAAHAGVSVKTVSNVVNGYAHVSPETRRRVQEVITELGYHPNLTARRLRTGHSGMVGLVVPDLAAPLHGELVRAVVSLAAEKGLGVLVEQTLVGGRSDRAAVDRIPVADGLICVPRSLTGEQLDAMSGGRPLVLLGPDPCTATVDRVVVNEVLAAEEATRHLIGLGRRRIAAIADRWDLSVGPVQPKLEGYARALYDARIEIDHHLVIPAGSSHRADGAAAMARLFDLEFPPDAVFCFDDLLALGALRAVLDRGLRVPEDIAVIGMGDVEDGRFGTPTLSTLATDQHELARVALTLLEQRQAEPGRKPALIELPAILTERESTLGRSEMRVPRRSLGKYRAEVPARGDSD
jgi:DNA-binding LacI/PurR family transcriptional regulator